MFDRLTENRRPQNPGILALTPSLEPLYFNLEAQELSRQMTGHDAALGEGTLPVEVFDLCREILTRLKVALDCKDFDQVHVRRIVGLRQPVLLQGFSIPNSHTLGSSLIIVLMEPLAAETVPEIQHARACFNLTDREMHVAEHLARGLTNKEIALTLHITEQTVKQHVKHMMLKTQSTTRTGVLAQLLNASRRAGPPDTTLSLREVS
jgi:DNA-binding CsgD family transcriptional regulator